MAPAPGGAGCRTDYWRDTLPARMTWLSFLVRAVRVGQMFALTCLQALQARAEEVAHIQQFFRENVFG